MKFMCLFYMSWTIIICEHCAKSLSLKDVLIIKRSIRNTENSVLGVFEVGRNMKIRIFGVGPKHLVHGSFIQFRKNKSFNTK